MEKREKSRVEAQERLIAFKTQEERNRLGQFATPPKLASQIVKYVLSLVPAESDIHFLEPGFGTGSFYSALLRSAPSSRIKKAVGYETDRDYVKAAKIIWKGTLLRLFHKDFTKAGPPKSEAARYDIVICNPPYVRHHHLTQRKKRELQAMVARRINFHMNGLGGLYTYFMVLSQAWMSKNGIAAWLIPSEFLDVNYGRKIKEFLAEKVTLIRIHRFNPNEVQFGDALVSSAIVVFKNSRPSLGSEAEFSFGGTILEPKTSSQVKVRDFCDMTKWTALSQRYRGVKNSWDGGTLADFFTIKRGLATGCNSFFVLTPERVSALGLPNLFVKPILPSPKDLDTDTIQVDEKGEPKIQQRRYLLSCNLPESDIKHNHMSLWKYLKQGIERGINERYLCRNREPWYSQEERAPAPFLCTYMGRPTSKTLSPFRFILNYSKAIAANVYLMLYPKLFLATLIEEYPEFHKEIWNALSSITPEMLVGEGRVYGGGLHKLEPKELGNVSAESLSNILSHKEKLIQQKELFSTASF